MTDRQVVDILRALKFPPEQSACRSCPGDVNTHRTFVFPCQPSDLGRTQFCDSCGSDVTAFWEDKIAEYILTRDPDLPQWICCYAYETSARAHCSCSPEHFMWVCRRWEGFDPCDNDFMKEISS